MKRSIIYLTTMLAATSLSAETLSPAQALARVQGSNTVRKIAGRMAVDATPARVVALESEPELYMFTPADGGLLLVSAESETPALIGYTDNYTPGDELPPALEGMMKSWAAEIAAQRDGRVIYGAESRAEADFAAIEPICKTKWDQDAPYNGKCPVLNGGRTYTGCVATAIAQVLKVHEYPVKCSGGTYSYWWRTGKKNLSLNFDDVTLDWDNMLDTYDSSATQEQKDAVATLMEAVGYAAEMDYMQNASGAHGLKLIQGLARNFGMDVSTLEYCNRSWYSLADWQQKVYNTLAEGYPVYYEGLTTDSQPVGHAFVVDGYRSDGFFHLNWGWSGVSDGYFRLTALDPDAQGIGGAYPSAGFDDDQTAIFGIKPATSAAVAPPRICTNGNFIALSSSAMLGSYVYFKFEAPTYNYGLTTVKIDPAIIIKTADGKTYSVNCGSAYLDYDPIGGFQSFDFPVVIPSTLPAGTYTITPAAYYAGKYYPVYCAIGYATSITATVSGSTITFENGTETKLAIGEVSVPEPIYTNRDFTISGEMSTLDSQDYYGKINAYLHYSDNGGTAAKLGTFMFSADGDAPAGFHANCKLTNDNLPSGYYEIGFTDMFGHAVSGRVPVRLEAVNDAATLKASDLECLDSNKDNLEFKVTLTASEGKFNGTVYIELHVKGDYNNYAARIPSETVEIANGGTKTITITGSFPEGIVGQDYTAYVYYNRLDKWTEASGRQRKNFTLTDRASIADIESTYASPAEYFDLSGRRILNPTRGLYLRRNGSKEIIL